MPLNKGTGLLFVVFLPPTGKYFLFLCPLSLFPCHQSFKGPSSLSHLHSFSWQIGSHVAPISWLWLMARLSHQENENIPLPFLRSLCNSSPLTASSTTVSFNFRNVPVFHTFWVLRFLSLQDHSPALKKGKWTLTFPLLALFLYLSLSLTWTVSRVLFAFLSWLDLGHCCSAVMLLFLEWTRNEEKEMR